MLVAPFVPTTRAPIRPVARRAFTGVRSAHATKRSAASIFTIAWLVLGLVALACVPALRGSHVTGYTLPFWLVFAPAINLAWLQRSTLAHWRGLRPNASAWRLSARERRPRRRWRR